MSFVVLLVYGCLLLNSVNFGASCIVELIICFKLYITDELFELLVVCSSTRIRIIRN